MNDPVEISFPYRGIDQSRGYSAQPPGTTPSCSNVRAYDANQKSRGSSRPGSSKVDASRAAATPVQCLYSGVIARDQRLGNGDVLGQGAVFTKARIFGQTAGATNYTYSGTLGGNNTLGCFDENGNAYFAVAYTGHVDVVKVTTAYAEAWTTSITVAGSGDPQLFGLVVFDGVVYVWIVGATSGSVSAPGIYRLATSSGANSGLWSISGLATVSGTQSVANQCLAAGGGLLGVVGNSGGALVLQQVTISSGVVARSTTLQSSLLNHPAKIVADGGANFYVLTNRTGGAVNKLFKINWSGAIDPTFNGGSAITSAGNNASDIAYNPVSGTLGVVGATIFGATESFQVYNATTGVKLSGAQQYNGSATATWDAIAADDQNAWRLRRRAASGNDLVSCTTPSATTVTWNQATGLGTASSPTLWLSCSGVQVAASPTTSGSTRIARKLYVGNGGLYEFSNGLSLVKQNFVNAGARYVCATINGLTGIFTDGSNYATLNLSTMTPGTLTATVGAIPQDINFLKCPLCCTWRGRLVLAAMLTDPHNWFMTRRDLISDFGYAPVNRGPAEPVAGNNAPAGLCSDKVTCLVPYDDQRLIFGCDSSIWYMAGDPADGGSFQRISNGVGMAFGKPYCYAPDGSLYFMSSRGAVFSLNPNGNLIPVRISQQISHALEQTNFAQTAVSMAWDEKDQGFHFFLSPLTTGAATHYWWDGRASYGNQMTGIALGAWFPVTFGNTGHNPRCVHVFDADDPNDRVVWLGGDDGFVRKFDWAANDDDGTALNWNVLFPPLVSQTLDEVRLDTMQAELGLSSSSCTYAVYTGRTAEAAFGASATRSGTWIAGRNNNTPVNRAGFAVYAGMSGTGAFQLERIRITGENLGPFRGRRK